MQFDKEINLKIIHALKSFVTRELRGLEAWKLLHEQLAANLREIRRISPKMLKIYVMKTLIFDIKRNRFKLPQEDVEILCYPFLAVLLNLKLMVLDNQKYPTIAPRKLKRQLVYIKYLLSRTRFNRLLWKLMHKYTEKYPTEYHYINVNNPQYCLTEKEKTYLRKFACKTTPEKSNSAAIERITKPNKWLSKRRSLKKSDPLECVVLNGMLPEKQLKDNLMDSPKMESLAPQIHSGEESGADEANESMNDETQLITGLNLAEDLLAINLNSEKDTVHRPSTPSSEVMEVIQLPSESNSEEPTFEIPFSFYEDSSDTSDFDEDVIYIS